MSSRRRSGSTRPRRPSTWPTGSSRARSASSSSSRASRHRRTAASLNHYFDRDLDERMRRTRSRPLPAHRVSTRLAVWWGIALNVVAFAVLALFTNLLAASLAIAGTLFYIGVYTLLLKRTTAQNIVIGGAAGAVPPLVGWAAITGSLDLAAWLLFAII